MKDDKRPQIERIVAKIPGLTNGQLYWVEKVIETFEYPHKYEVMDSDLLDRLTIENFGDALRIHHTFSAEPFSKDKFEYVLAATLKMSGHSAKLAPKGNRGHDITVDNCPISLKTQADRDISEDKIWISKFMELGKGKWGDDPRDLETLRDMFLCHLDKYERILVLRNLERGPNWRYELVEVPKSLLMTAEKGTLEMRMESSQFPKPGYCHVLADDGSKVFQLYFDGGTERKLQIQKLLKSQCLIHAQWQFAIPHG